MAYRPLSVVLTPSELQALGTALHNRTMVNFARNLEYRQILNVLRRIGPAELTYNNYRNLGTGYTLAINRAIQYRGQNKQAAARNIMILKNPRLYRLPPRDLKQFFKIYGKFMLKRNRNLLAGRPRGSTLQNAFNIYNKAYPERRKRAAA